MFNNNNDVVDSSNDNNDNSDGVDSNDDKRDSDRCIMNIIEIGVILKEILMIISVDILNDRAIYKRNLTNTRAFIQRMVVIEIIFSY